MSTYLICFHIFITLINLEIIIQKYFCFCHSQFMKQFYFLFSHIFVIPIATLIHLSLIIRAHHLYFYLNCWKHSSSGADVDTEIGNFIPTHKYHSHNIKKKISHLSYRCIVELATTRKDLFYLEKICLRRQEDLMIMRSYPQDKIFFNK